MTYGQFLEGLRQLGFEESGDSMGGTVEFEGNEGRFELTFFLEPEPIDSETHFSAEIIGSEGADEYILIHDDGPYKGRIFQNLHDEGVSTLEDLMEDGDFDEGMLADGEEGLDYADTPKLKRIEWQLFFDMPVADSLEAFVATMRAAG